MDLGEFLQKWLRRILFFCVLGFVLLVSATFLLKLVGYLLILALIGFLLWLPFHSAIMGKQFSWKESRNRVCTGIRKGLHILFPRSEPEKWPGYWQQKWAQVQPFILPVLLEAFCGAGIGCLFVILRNRQVSEEPLPLILGAVLGTLVGFWVGYRQKEQGKKVSEKADTDEDS